MKDMIYTYVNRVTRCCSDTPELPEFFPVECCLEPLGQHCIEFFPCNVVQGVIRQHCTGFYLCNFVWSLSDNIEWGFDLCSCPKSIKNTLKAFDDFRNKQQKCMK